MSVLKVSAEEAPISILPYVIQDSKESPQKRSELAFSYSKFGFLGEDAMFFGFPWGSFEMIFGFGQFQLSGENFYQLNAGGHYYPASYQFGRFQWRPFGAGAYAMYADADSQYFLTSPDIYPYPNYYEQTALRMAFSLATSLRTIAFKRRVEFIYQANLIDTGVVVIFNNPSDLFIDFWSSGIMFKMDLEEL